MNKLMKLQLEQSEKRQRFAELHKIEERTDEQNNEYDEVLVRLEAIEPEMRSEMRAEAVLEETRAGEFGNGDGEPAEIRSLLNNVGLADYLNPAASKSGRLETRAAELNDALGADLTGRSGGIILPWKMLETPEMRVFTTTTNNDGSNVQHPILMRLFGMDVMMALGVNFRTVPSGQSEFQVIASGVSPAQAKEGTAAADATVAGFTFGSHKPKRLTGEYELTHEALASVGDLEQAIRRDLADAVKAQMSNLIINGVAPTTTNPQNVEGFLTKITSSDLSSALATASDWGRLHAIGVDGIHASHEKEVMSVIGTASYTQAAGVYIAGSGESGSELLMKRSGGCMASSFIPAAVSMKQKAILHSAGPNGGADRFDSAASVWSGGLELIRDQYTQASVGIVLTWVALWDATTALRPGAYAVRDVQISS